MTMFWYFVTVVIAIFTIPSMILLLWRIERFYWTDGDTGLLVVAIVVACIPVVNIACSILLIFMLGVVSLSKVIKRFNTTQLVGIKNFINYRILGHEK